MPVTPVKPAQLNTYYHDELNPAQRASLLSWLAFTGTFAGVRALTYSIKNGRGPVRNLQVGGLHLHHYLWGISLVSLVGGVAVHGEDGTRRHPLVATGYGGGLALIVDEFALLLDLKDVYWAREGRLSVDVAIGTIAATGSYLVGLPLWRRIRREHLSAS